MTDSHSVHRPDDLLRAGDALLTDGRPDEALCCFDHALANDPARGRAHLARGQALLALRRMEDARLSLRRAVEHGVAPDLAAQDRWICAMLRGDFAEAWRLSDDVLARRPRHERNRKDQPFHLRHVWDGVPLAGRDVLVRCYHGLGDTIQFIRYIPQLACIARSVTVQAVRELHGLLGSVTGVNRLVPLGYDQPDPPFEVDVEVMELAYAFRTTLASLPCDVPYVGVDPARRAAAACRVRGERRLKVGLVWAAGAWDPRRSIPLSDLSMLRDLPGIAFFNLQRGPALGALPSRDAPEFADDPASWTDDIADTAATLLNLDLVVAVDTMVAHLAGALGLRVWTLLHFAADWRWMHGRDDSPWYPTMRLFRQPAPGAWAPVTSRVADRLRAAAQCRASPRISSPISS